MDLNERTIAAAERQTGRVNAECLDQRLTPSQRTRHLPEDVLQHVGRQRGRTEHDEQTLLGLTVRGGELLQGGQVDVGLNPGHRGGGGVALEDTDTHTHTHTHCVRLCVI